MHIGIYQIAISIAQDVLYSLMIFKKIGIAVKIGLFLKHLTGIQLIINEENINYHD